MSKEIYYREMMRKIFHRLSRLKRKHFRLHGHKEIFEHEMNGNDYAHYIVAVDDDEVIGHCGMWIVLDECHITNVAVRKHMRGNGIGEGLMREAIGLCKELDVSSNDAWKFE